MDCKDVYSYHNLNGSCKDVYQYYKKSPVFIPGLSRPTETMNHCLEALIYKIYCLNA